MQAVETEVLYLATPYQQLDRIYLKDDTDLIDEWYPESVNSKYSKGFKRKSFNITVLYGARTGFLILEEKRKGGSRKSTVT